MDRHLSKGTAGLSAAWLAAGANITWEEHQCYKEILSAADSFDERNTARRELLARIGTEPLVSRFLSIEAGLRDGDGDEPPVIKCPPVRLGQPSS